MSQIEEEKRNDKLVDDARTSKERAEWLRFQQKKLEDTELAERKRVASVPQREQLARTTETPLPKRKGTEPSVLSTKS